MATVLLQDHNNEIKKHEKLLDVAIDKLISLKKEYMVGQIELKVAESYIDKLRQQIVQLKENPVKPQKIPQSSTNYLEKLQLALELNDIDTKKITDDYINRKKYGQ
jgi:hypothetical protein